MTRPDTPPIACTLAPGEYLARLAWIAELARDGLRSSERRDLELELHYGLETADRVREMVRRERACCAFLTFDLQETSEEIQLIIRAPEQARGAAHLLFAVFASAAMTKSEKAARTAAVVSATGALACGVYCVLPLALLAVLLAGGEASWPGSRARCLDDRRCGGRCRGCVGLGIGRRAWRSTAARAPGSS